MNILLCLLTHLKTVNNSGHKMKQVFFSQKEKTLLQNTHSTVYNIKLNKKGPFLTTFIPINHYILLFTDKFIHSLHHRLIDTEL